MTLEQGDRLIDEYESKYSHLSGESGEAVRSFVALFRRISSNMHRVEAEIADIKREKGIV